MTPVEFVRNFCGLSLNAIRRIIKNMRQELYIAASKYTRQGIIAVILSYIIYFAICVKYTTKKILHKKVIIRNHDEKGARSLLQKVWPEKEIVAKIENQQIDESIDVSIIVPVYNYEKVLDKMIQSVLKQITSYHFELILVDDGSNEATKEILRKYTKESFRQNNNPIVHVIEQENQGISAARNTGINAAKGRYLMFVDCDDTLQENCVQVMLEEAYRGNYDIVMAGHTLVKENNGEVFHTRKYIYSKYNLANYKDGDFIMNYPGLPWGKLYKRELFELIRFPVGYWYEDTVIQFLVFRKAKTFSYLPVSLYNYKWYEGNFSKEQKKSNNQVLEHYWIIERMLEENSRVGLLEDVILYKTVLRHLGRYLYRAVEYLPNETLEAVFILSRSLLEKYKPKEKYHLNYQLRELEKAFNKSDFELWKLVSASL